ncbi:DUF4309 domain-containing protein [Chengkuizengella sediminis]|uniref:DUF4309 domain-containing protein n=1 Tax=Chengkuizengella sediminis TaxID=1885917 RepID=UPI001389BA70|nr:lipoprotein [Chengkuizengella sediminis]NDI35041.1 DUF4309 domain-containing protein [Chengkuizengella sediminis]
MKKLLFLLIFLVILTGCNQSEDSVFGENFLDNAKKGILDGCEIQLSESITQEVIIDELGTQEDIFYWEGGKGLKYNKCVYFFPDDGSEPPLHISSIEYNEDQLNITLDDVIREFGKPNYSKENDSIWLVIYEFDLYSLKFESIVQEPTTYRIKLMYNK